MAAVIIAITLTDIWYKKYGPLDFKGHLNRNEYLITGTMNGSCDKFTLTLSEANQRYLMKRNRKFKVDDEFTINFFEDDDPRVNADVNLYLPDINIRVTSVHGDFFTADRFTKQKILTGNEKWG